MLNLNTVFERVIEDESVVATREMYAFFHDEFYSKLTALQEKLMQFHGYTWLLEKKLEALAPEDPLVKDPAGEVKIKIQSDEKRRADRKDEKQTIAA